MAYDLRLGGMVGTVAAVTDVDGNPIPVGFDYEAVTVGIYRFGPDAVAALMAAIVAGSADAAKNVLGSEPDATPACSYGTEQMAPYLCQGCGDPVCETHSEATPEGGRICPDCEG